MRFVIRLVRCKPGLARFAIIIVRFRRLLVRFDSTLVRCDGILVRSSSFLAHSREKEGAQKDSFDFRFKGR